MKQDAVVPIKKPKGGATSRVPALRSDVVDILKRAYRIHTRDRVTRAAVKKCLG